MGVHLRNHPAAVLQKLLAMVDGRSTAGAGRSRRYPTFTTPFFQNSSTLGLTLTLGLGLTFVSLALTLTVLSSPFCSRPGALVLVCGCVFTINVLAVALDFRRLLACM